MNYYLKAVAGLWILFSIVDNSLFGQNLPVPPKTETKWGIVPPEDMSMEVYKLDPSAPAVILWDHGTWTPENWEKGKVRLFRHVRIKILKEEGLKYAQQEIRYQQGEKLGGFRAQTLNWNFGKMRAIPSKVETKALPPDSLDGGDVIKSFTFPDVEVGSIIEYRYSLVAEAFDELKPWYFQSELPTRWSEVQTRGFDPYIYKSVPIGAEVSPGRRGIWRAKFVSALPQEAFAGNPNQYRAGVRFYITQLFNDKTAVKQRWKDLRERLQYSTYLDPDQKALNALYSISQDLVKDAITNEEKLALVHDHVRKQVKWNGKYEIWVQNDPAKVYKSRKGNGVEINMLLFYMLDMAELKPEQVFVSTKSNGPASKSPLFSQYNHLICRVEVDGNSFYLDATQKSATYDLPPTDVMTPMALLLKDTTTHLINLQSRARSASLWMIQADVSDESVDIEVKESHSGYAALNRRNLLKENRSGVIHSGSPFRPISQQTVAKPNYESIDEPSLPLDIYYKQKLEANEYIERKGDSLFLSPLLCFSTFMPFKGGERRLPIDMEHARDFNILINFKLPEGYELTEIPKPFQLALSGRSLTYNLQSNQIGEMVSVQSRFVIKAPYIYPEDYPALREFYQKMISRESEPLIFVKKKS
ncbi:MAG: DUF3857 domain-containing protein [Bacteroidota bacterium]